MSLHVVNVRNFYFYLHRYPTWPAHIINISDSQVEIESFGDNVQIRRKPDKLQKFRDKDYDTYVNKGLSHRNNDMKDAFQKALVEAHDFELKHKSLLAQDGPSLDSCPRKRASVSSKLGQSPTKIHHGEILRSLTYERFCVSIFLSSH